MKYLFLLTLTLTFLSGVSNSFASRFDSEKLTSRAACRGPQFLCWCASESQVSDYINNRRWCGDKTASIVKMHTEKQLEEDQVYYNCTYEVAFECK